MDGLQDKRWDNYMRAAPPHPIMAGGEWGGGGGGGGGGEVGNVDGKREGGIKDDM